MTAIAIRTKLYDYIRTANDKHIYTLLGPQIEDNYEWWKDEQLLAEFDERSKALETKKDKGFSLNELDASIDKLRREKYGK